MREDAAADAHRRVARTGARPRRGARPLRRGGGRAAAASPARPSRSTVDGVPLSAAAGLDGGAERRGAGAVSGPPDGSRVRAVGISYHYPRRGARRRRRSGRRSRSRSRTVHGQLGFLTVFGAQRGASGRPAATSRRSRRSPPHGAGDRERAQRRDAQRRCWPTSTPLTGLGNRQALHETLALEVARAHRHGTRLAVCVLRHRRLQADERPDRAPRGRRDPRRGRGRCSARRSVPTTSPTAAAATSSP